jgi:para-nitrobenzyl esterase
LFGESAGGENIAALMLTPSAKGLFHKAIIQSGAVGPKATIDQNIALSAAQKIYDGIDVKSIEAARQKDWQELMSLPEKTNIPYYHYVVADGEYTLAEPHYISDVPLLIGSNRNEDLMYLSDNAHNGLSDLLNEYDNAAGLQKYLEQYSSDPMLQMDFFGTATSFLCPSLEIATNVKSNTYVYNFTRVRKGAEKIGAYHGGEIPYVFNTLDEWLPTDDVDKKLTETMMDYWVNFANSGNPNGETVPIWESYSIKSPFTMELGAIVKRSNQTPEKFCALLN